MIQELWDLIGRDYSDPEDDEYALLFSKDGVHIGDAVEKLFSEAQGNCWIRDYDISVPCVYESIRIAIYVLIATWIDKDGTLQAFYQEVRS